MQINSHTTPTATVEAKVIRADGRVEDLGRIAYWHPNPLRRVAWRVGRWLRGLRKPNSKE